MTWHKVWLFAHIIAAIVAFGPTFVFPMITGKAKEQPQHAPFATLISYLIAERIMFPLAVTMAISGIGLIFTGTIDFFSTGWLIASVLLYIAALLFSFFVQRRNNGRMLEIMRSMPPGPPPEGQGPQPEVLELGKKLTTGGALLTAATVAIIILMVWQPGGTAYR